MVGCWTINQSCPIKVTIQLRRDKNPHLKKAPITFYNSSVTSIQTTGIGDFVPKPKNMMETVIELTYIGLFIFVVLL